ncbi:MAG: nuclear transport factor 2 family protein [Thermomicrobiales bacterium]
MCSDKVQFLSPTQVIDKFNDAWNAADLDGVLAMITADCVFENTSPPPDGATYVGKTEIAAAWAPVLATPGMHFEAEEVFAAGDRVVIRWIYHWVNSDGSAGHIRGVDVMTVRDGLVAEKLSYVKG